MKTTNTFYLNSLCRKVSYLLLCMVFPSVVFMACSDDIDESNMYTFSGKMTSSYLSEQEAFSEYYRMLQMVKLSDKSLSTVADLLSARGHYTVFAPTNEAVHTYVDSIMGESNYDLSLLPDSIKEYIVKNSIIDNGDEKAYKTSDFNIEGALSSTNMNDRYITINFKTVNGKGVIVINNLSNIIASDLETENGVIHVVDHVVSSSMSTLSSLISQTSNIRIFSKLLEETGWADSMIVYLDKAYEEYHIPTVPSYWANQAPFQTPDHRKHGFTAFIEPDELLVEKWGIPMEVSSISGQITNWDAILSIIKEKCANMPIYAAKQKKSCNPNVADDLKDQDNVVNQFVAYHLLKQAIPYNKLVIHFNEMGFAYNRPENLTLNCYNYYVTRGKNRRLLKIIEGRATNGKFINRRSTYDNRREGTYNELSVLYQGVKVLGDNGIEPTNALNGNYYLIDKILEYDEATENALANERIRFDVNDYMYELSSNNIRRPNAETHIGFPLGYFENLTISNETYSAYESEYTPMAWRNYMGDEIMLYGQYDFTYKLPPVPVTGTYELRMGVSNNPYRGMAQIYLGTNKENLQAVGLPVDMRLKGVDPLVGWEADTNDQIYNISIDKAMRNHGYMKAPQFSGLTSGSGVTTSLRAVDGSGNSALRFIITTQTFEADKTYYLRYKSILEDKYAQFFFDYLELVPKAVINAGEDIW